MRRTWAIFACLTAGWACDETERVECENSCECWAALNECISTVVEQVRWDDEDLFRANELESVWRRAEVPRQPTADELEVCTQAQIGQLLAIKNQDFTELDRCEDSTRWAPRYVD